MDAPGWTHREDDVGGVRLHWREAGPEDGPAVLLLHGFPETGRAWRRQVPALADAGFRVVVPDQRGYGRSAKPRGAAEYRIERLVGDVLALADHVGAERFHLAGHDWGGMVAWHAAMLHPERLERLVVANAPHPAALARELRRGWEPRRRSWYVLLFQLPLLPEALLRAGDFALLRRAFQGDPVRPGAFDEDDLRAYAAAWAEPGALTAMLNWYRAARRFPPPRVVPIPVPTLLLWGERDRHLSRRLAEGLERWVPDLRVERLPEASHWVLADRPRRTSEAMVAFLRGG